MVYCIFSDHLFVWLESKIVVVERQDMSRVICRLCLKLDNDSLLVLIQSLNSWIQKFEFY